MAWHYEVKKSDEEIEELLNQCTDAENEGRTKFRGMTYEQGIRYGLEWLFGEIEEHPLED